VLGGMGLPSPAAYRNDHSRSPELFEDSLKGVFVFTNPHLSRGIGGICRALTALGFVLLFSSQAQGQTWSWQTETIDRSAKFTSLAVDADGDLHVSYADGQGWIKYAFRPAGSSKWFSMKLDAADAFTDLALDSQGNPHICYTGKSTRYAYWDGKKWQIQSVATDAAPVWYSCRVGIGPDGTPHLTWYREKNPDLSNYLHLKYAVLENGMWVVRTVDFDGQTGKWHSMFVDSKGVPHLTYDAYVDGRLKYAAWDGKHWNVSIADFRGHTNDQWNLGMGNSLVLNSDGQALISYYDNGDLKCSRQQGTNWKVETVDTISARVAWLGYRSSIALDSRGNPHISYEDAGTLKHAYWDGKQWRIQIIAPRGPDDLYRFSSLAIDHEDTIYVSYRDPVDSSLKVATGRLTQVEPQKTAASASSQP
jgi:hypothetical protein